MTDTKPVRGALRAEARESGVQARTPRAEGGS